jgi:hypothetical protein
MKMKSIISIIGILLIIGGIASFAYKYFSYTTQEKVAEIGIANVANLKVTEQKENRIYIPPVVSGLSVGVGLVLVIVAMRRKD